MAVRSELVTMMLLNYICRIKINKYNNLQRKGKLLQHIKNYYSHTKAK